MRMQNILIMAKLAKTKKTFIKRNNNKNAKQYKGIPGNILIPTEWKKHIDEIIDIYAPDFEYKCKKEFFYYIIYTILKRQNSYENKALNNASVALNAGILKGYASNYNEYMRYLCDHEIIIKTNNHSSGNSSRKYCFSDFVFSLSEKNKDFEVVDMAKMKSSKIYVEKSIKDSPIYYSNEHLLKWFNDKLVIDFENAKKYIDDEILDENDIHNNKNKKIYWMNQISIIHHKVFRATRNEESDYRLHTPLTNFKKDFKKFITYDSKKLIGYDLKNSQPFFLLVLINNLINRNNEYVNRICNSIYKKNHFNTFMLPNLSKLLSSRGFKDEYILLKNWILDGELYENMALILEPKQSFTGKFTDFRFIKELGIKCITVCDTERELMKSVFIRTMFCRNNSNDNFYLKFKEKMPHFINLLEILKDKKHKNLSRLLQNIESECVIDFTTRKIAEKHPEMPLFTIHDSISTTEDYAKILEEEMIEYILEFTGFLPRIEKEKW